VNSNYSDIHCGGGVYWDLGRTYKNAVTNELFIELGVKLYESDPSDPERATYLEITAFTTDWLLYSPMIDS